MRIGIITFHRAENFGAVMQCYALQTYLSELGHDVRIIDYRCKTIEQVYHVFNPYLIFSREGRLVEQAKAYLGRLKTWRDRINKKRKYVAFRKTYLQQTSPVYSIKDIIDYDAIIVGSDQVWNTALVGGLDPVYFLAGKMSARKIAYAASTEGYSYPHYQANADRLSALINDFHSISVRENCFREELKKYTDRNIVVCVDPVFLLKKDFYQRLIIHPLNERDYILVYHLIDSNEMSSMARDLGRKRNKKVIELHAGFGKDENNANVIHRHNVGPTELLSYIANANMMLTTSFHGLAFSIIFHIPFWVIDNGSTHRQRHLLTALGLESRVIKDINTIGNHKEINFITTEERLKTMVETSTLYLTESLQE